MDGTAQNPATPTLPHQPPGGAGRFRGQLRGEHHEELGRRERVVERVVRAEDGYAETGRRCGQAARAGSDPPASIDRTGQVDRVDHPSSPPSGRSTEDPGQERRLDLRRPGHDDPVVQRLAQGEAGFLDAGGTLEIGSTEPVRIRTDAGLGASTGDTSWYLASRTIARPPSTGTTPKETM